MVAKLFLLQFYLFGCVIVRLRKMLFAVAGLRPQNILLVFLASLENLKFRYEIVLQPSQYTWPIFIVIFSFFFLKEKITIRNIIAVILGFLGVFVVLTKGNLEAVNLNNLSTDFIVLFAASVFGLFSVLSKKADFEPFSATTLFFLSATLFSFITMLLFSHFATPSKNELIPILSNGIFINGFFYIFWLKGLSYAKASFVAPFVFTTPIFAAILIILFFQEAFLPVYFFGLILVIFAGLVSK